MLFGNKIRQLREEKQMLQRQFLCKVSANRTCSSLPNRSQKWRKQFAAALEIDTPMYSKIERGERRAKREQVIALAKIFKVNPNEFLTLWIADRSIEAIDDEKELAGKALNVVIKHIKNG
jgi:transcriptional regulator with XRE-family HTH domain